MDKNKVAFIGLGNMGFPMMENLVKAGYEVYGIDVVEEAEKKCKEVGGKTGYTAENFPDDVGILFTSLPTPDIVENVYLGENGIVNVRSEPMLLVDLSTISPDLNRKIAKEAKDKGFEYLGAPVSGSVSGARTATLTVMAGGEKSGYNKAKPYLEAIGKNIFHVDTDPALGTVVKLINNLMAGIHTQTVSEGFAIADKLGVDHQTLHDVVAVSSGNSTMLGRNYNDFISKHEYIDGMFSTSLLLKDVRLANQVSSERGLELPLGSTLKEYLEEHIGEVGNEDMSATYKLLK